MDYVACIVKKVGFVNETKPDPTLLINHQARSMPFGWQPFCPRCRPMHASRCCADNMTLIRPCDCMASLSEATPADAIHTNATTQSVNLHCRKYIY